MKRIPEYFNVTDDDVKHLIGNGKSLKSEMKVRYSQNLTVETKIVLVYRF